MKEGEWVDSEHGARENGSQLGSSFAGRDDGVWLCAEEG